MVGSCVDEGLVASGTVVSFREVVAGGTLALSRMVGTFSDEAFSVSGIVVLHCHCERLGGDVSISVPIVGQR